MDSKISISTMYLRVLVLAATFGNKMAFFTNLGIRSLHLSTDKSTGKYYLSGAINVRLGQHGQLISPPLMVTSHTDYANLVLAKIT